jgi:hypothetical protein
MLAKLTARERILMLLDEDRTSKAAAEHRRAEHLPLQ